MDDLACDAQPICPACGVTMQPRDGGDECWECGYRIDDADADADRAWDDEAGLS